MISNFTLQELESELEAITCDRSSHSGPITKRKLKNGSIHNFKQCQRCGEPIGSAIKITDDEIIFKQGFISEFDSEISERYEARRMEIFERIQAEKKSIQPKLTTIDRSKSEKEIRFERINEEICNIFASINDIETARFVESKVLEQLRSHINIYESYDAVKIFSSESEVELWLINFLSKDFEIFSQVYGKHVVEDAGVKIDCLIYPKPHLISAGFVEAYIGVEVKFFHPNTKFCRRSSRAWWQTISYLDCVFDVNGVNVKPKFGLLFSNLSFDGEIDYLKRYFGVYDNDVIMWWAYKHLANHANVGSLEIKGNPQKNSGWRMRFAGSDYFSVSEWNGIRSYSTPQEAIVNKVRIGNF